MATNHEVASSNLAGQANQNNDQSAFLKEVPIFYWCRSEIAPLGKGHSRLLFIHRCTSDDSDANAGAHLLYLSDSGQGDSDLDLIWTCAKNICNFN
jgi:hypothetical protein